jgi:hypothetical protein
MVRKKFPLPSPHDDSIYDEETGFQAMVLYPRPKKRSFWRRVRDRVFGFFRRAEPEGQNTPPPPLPSTDAPAAPASPLPQQHQPDEANR